MNEQTIFTAALEREPGQRMAFLAEACGSDAGLRARVEKLLHLHAAAGGFLEQPAAAQVGLTTDQPPAERPGTEIGPYKLLQQIGEGGMGMVYMAEQEQPVRRRVALKIIKPGMDTRQVIARFEAERQALSLMDHPNIAKVLDAGTTGPEKGDGSLLPERPAGCFAQKTPVPFFVMELVRGTPITKYCDEHHLTPRQRLELLLPVCHAIQHAHQKGIIHRDIKPTNILVAEYDEKPVPKVIDFGVAKAIGQSLTEKTTFTGFGQLVGTLEYMSPEQAQFNQIDIDTRSDIYSLGVLMYELLTGSTPVEQARVRTLPFDETLRIIREEEPPKPSTRLSASDTLETVAANRSVDVARLRKLLRGELDWIVMKALEKDRNRRFETVNGLARDIERYLHDEPVQACPPSVRYRIGKAVRKNRWTITVLTLLAVTLLSVVGSVGWLVRDQAARREEVSREIDLVLREASKLRDEDRWPDARTNVEQAERLLVKYASQAEHQRVLEMKTDLAMVARLEGIRLRSPMDPLGALDKLYFEDVYGNYAAAFQEYGIDIDSMSADAAAKRIRASAIRKQLISALNDWYWVDAGRFQFRLSSQPVRERESAKSAHLRSIANAADTNDHSRLIRNATGQYDKQALIELASRADIATLPSTSIMLLSEALWRAGGERGRAIELLAAGIRRAPNDLAMNFEIVRLLSFAGRSDEAVGYARVAVALRPNAAVLHRSLSGTLARTNRYDEAATVIRQAIALEPGIPQDYSSLGRMLADGGRFDEAIAAHSEAVRLHELRRRNTPPKPTDLAALTALQGRAGCYKRQGNWQKAIGDYSQVINTNSKSLEAWLGRCQCWMQQGQWDKAGKDAARALELKRSDSELHFVLAACLLMSGYDAGYRKACEEALQRFAGVEGDGLTPYFAARACVLAADGVALPPELRSRAEQIAVAPGGGGWAHLWARELCRGEKYQNARAALEAALKQHPNWDNSTCLNSLLLALVHHRLGNAEEARQRFAQVQERLKKGDQEKGNAETFPVHIVNWLSCQVLLREVEATLKKEPVAKGQEPPSEPKPTEP